MAGAGGRVGLFDSPRIECNYLPSHLTSLAMQSNVVLSFPMTTSCC